MNKREFAKLKKRTDTLTDEQLKEKYYDAVFDTLGSQAEEMYERGYDEADIREREKYERWLSRQSDMLEEICREKRTNRSARTRLYKLCSIGSLAK